jgi:hypothetical protein
MILYLLMSKKILKCWYCGEILKEEFSVFNKILLFSDWDGKTRCKKCKDNIAINKKSFCKFISNIELSKTWECRKFSEKNLDLVRNVKDYFFWKKFNGNWSYYNGYVNDNNIGDAMKILMKDYNIINKKDGKIRNKKEEKYLKEFNKKYKLKNVKGGNKSMGIIDELNDNWKTIGVSTLLGYFFGKKGSSDKVKTELRKLRDKFDDFLDEKDEKPRKRKRK